MVSAEGLVGAGVGVGSLMVLLGGDGVGCVLVNFDYSDIRFILVMMVFGCGGHVFG